MRRGKGNQILSPADTKSEKGGNRNDKAEPIDTPLDTRNLVEGPATAKPTGIFLRRKLPDLGPSRAKGSTKQGIRGIGGKIGDETNNTEKVDKRSIEMKKFWNLNNRGMNSQIITRRSSMKKLIALGIGVGLAVAAIVGTTTMNSVLNAAEPTGTVSVVISEQTARDLVDFNNGFYAVELLEVEAKVIDAAELDERTATNLVDFQNGEHAGSEMAKVDRNIVGGQTPRDLVDFHNGFYAGEMLESEGKVIDAAELDEHTARNLVDFQNGEYAGSEMAKVDRNIVGGQTPRDLVDFHNGFYAGSISDLQ